MPSYKKQYPFPCKSKYVGWKPFGSKATTEVLEVRATDPAGGGSARVALVSRQGEKRILPYGRISHAWLLENVSERRAYLRDAWEEGVSVTSEDPTPPRKRKSPEHRESSDTVGRGVTPGYVAPKQTAVGLVYQATALIEQISRDPELKEVFEVLWERMVPKPELG